MSESETSKSARRWEQIAEEAARKQDPQRLAELTEELNRVLEGN